MAEILPPSTPVEARSLSSIASIAANPPAYPRNPVQARHDRIELYIVKVPGSKDVVLTPLKPPTKSNISIEAINSSLYYLHVVNEEDERILRDIELEQAKQLQEGHSHHDDNASSAPHFPGETFTRLNDFHRKPLRVQDTSVNSSSPPQPPPHREGVSGLRYREEDQPSKDVNDLQDQPNTAGIVLSDSHTATHDFSSSVSRPISKKIQQQNDIVRNFTVPRRPVTNSGTSTSEAQSVNYIVPNTSHVGQSLPYDDPRLAKENGRSQQRFPTEKISLGDASSPTDNEAEPSHVIGDQNNVPPFYITVIRRDVASGNQWNVATITSSPEDQGVIHVEISNPGYGKFIDSVPRPAAPGGQCGAQTVADVLKMSQNIMHSDRPGKRSFQRDIVPTKHGSHQSQSLSEVLFNRRPGSADSSKFANIVSSTRVGRGYYSFKSPWDGTCSFVASVNGGSLKCKHMIPGPAVNAESDSGGHNAGVTVAELRYNIPFALEQSFRPPTIGLSSHSKSPGERGKSKRAALSKLITTNMQKVQQHARSRSQGALSSPATPVPHNNWENQSPSPAVTAEDRLDLSLARELGGGGMSGKSAKLGKLIIEDEGVKMIDLVVAASMGVWWRSSHQPS